MKTSARDSTNRLHAGRKDSTMLSAKPRNPSPASSVAGRRLLTASLCLLITLASVTSADADILDSILSLATQARNVATQARDRAIEARNSVNEVRTKVLDGAKHLTGKVRTMLEEAVEDLKTQIDIVTEGRDEFVSEGCVEFREQLIGTMVGVQDVALTVQELLSCQDDEDIDPIIDFEREIALVEKIPCRLLYPLAQIRLPACFGERLSDAAKALRILKDFVKESRDAVEEAPESIEDDPQAFSEARMKASRVWRLNYRLALVQQAHIERLAADLTLVGKLLAAIGETNFEGSIGIHGYPSITVSANQAKKISGFFTALGDYVTRFSKITKSLISEAENVSIQDMILANQEAIISNQKLILGIDD